MDLKSVLEKSARRFGDKTAILMGEQRVSFRQLNEDANRVAHALLKLGLKKGDRVATMQGSNPEFAAVFFGILKAGCIAVPLDSRYVPDELASLFADCTPRVLAIEKPQSEGILPCLDRFPSIDHVITFEPDETVRSISYQSILADNPATNPDTVIDPADICIISYTGGPTINPHGVCLSHGPICEEARCSAETIGQTEEDVFIQYALPTYHQFGLTAVLLASIATGNTLVSVPGTGRSVDTFMKAVEEHKGTIYMGVPYIYSLMVNVARREGIKYDLSSLRFIASAGAPLEPAVIRLFQRYFKRTILDMYGQTESICQATVMPLDGSGPIGSSGKPMSCWELKIFDDDDNEVPAGNFGEIALRGPVMTCFWQKPEATARVLRNGWLHTGDMGYVDDNGFLFITARKRRLVILKGQNIIPSDIEKVLESHPSVAEAKVMGVLDLIRGETVRALVRPLPGQVVNDHELRQYCQGKMADYKLPREIIIVDEMPEEIPNWKRPRDKEKADITQEGKG